MGLAPLDATLLFSFYDFVRCLPQWIAPTPPTGPCWCSTSARSIVQLIARRVREQHAFARIVRHDITVERVRELNPLAIILSGGPSSVYEAGAPRCDPRLFDLGVPVLAICYGMQLACEALGGKVEPPRPASSAGPNAGSRRRRPRCSRACPSLRTSG